MKFLIDNAISPLLAASLRTLGYDVEHVRDYGMQAAEDEAVLARAKSEDRVLISKDTDFGELLAATAAHSPSVILFRRASDQPDAQLKLLLASFETIKEEINKGCIVIIENHRVWIRALPIA